MSSDLREEYDYVILGSNFENSVLAGALSRIGKRVILIDQNSYYGSNNATFCFSELRAFGDKNLQKEKTFNVAPFQIVEIIDILNKPITKREVVWDKDTFDLKDCDPIIPEKSVASDIHIHSTKEIWNDDPMSHWQESLDMEKVYPELQERSRRYNLDLTSSLLLSRGDLVNVLAESGLGQYLQFYPLNSISALINDESPRILQLPCSRQEVFSSKAISLKDKRLLSKFIQFIGDSCMDADETKHVNDVELKQGRSLNRPQNKAIMEVDLDKYATTPFTEFLDKEFHITGLLKDMILYSICLSGSETTVLSSNNEYHELLTSEGIKRVQEFILSLNIYGNTPFLYPIYGGGDILQSFCRMHNVYTGISMLQTDILSVITDSSDKKIIGIEIANENIHTVIRCKNVIAADEYPFSLQTKPERIEGNIAHGIYIVKGNNKDVTTENEGVFGDVKNKDKDLRELIVVPATSSHRAIYMLILNSEFKLTASEENAVLAYMEIESHDDVEAQYKAIDDAVNLYCSQLHSTIPVEILYGCHFVDVSFKCENVPENYLFFPTRLEECYLYMDHRVKRVQSLFNELCPGSQFLPKTLSSVEAEKEDTMDQELYLFDKLMDEIDSKECDVCS